MVYKNRIYYNTGNLLFLSIFPCNISCRILHRSLFLIMCPMFSSFRAFIAVSSSFCLSILSSTFLLVIRYVHEICATLRIVYYSFPLIFINILFSFRLKDILFSTETRRVGSKFTSQKGYFRRIIILPKRRTKSAQQSCTRKQS